MEINARQARQIERWQEKQTRRQEAIQKGAG